MTSNREPPLEAATTAVRAPRWPRWLGGGLAFLATLALDARSLWNGFAWDDEVWLTPAGRGCPDGLLSCFSGTQLDSYHRPLTALGFELHAWLGLPSAPWAYHLENLMLRALFVGSMVWVLSRFASLWAGLLAALVLVVHPLSATAAAWIGVRPDLLSMCLVAVHLVALDVALRRSSRWWFAGALLALGLAMLSKEQVALTLLASVGLVLERLPSARARWRPVLALVVSAAVVGLLVLPQAAATVETPWPVVERARVVGWTASAFGAALVLPDVDLLHTFVIVDDPWLTLRGALGLLALVALAWASRSEPAGRLGTVLVLTTLAPVLNVVPLGSMFFAAYRAIPCLVGLALLLAATLDVLGRRVAWPALGAVTAVYALLLVPAHLEELDAWADHDSASAYAVDAAPDDLYDRALLVERLREGGQTARALEVLHDGLLRFAPEASGDPARLAALSPEVLRARALLQYKPSLAKVMRTIFARLLSLEGLLLDELGRTDEARRWYEAALTLAELTPIRRRLEEFDAAGTSGRPPTPIPRGWPPP